MNVCSAFVLAAALIVIAAGPACADETLARKAGCLECHSVDKKNVGPAFHDIAARYKGISGARSALQEKVRRGGKGNWTDITGGAPMPAHSALISEEEIGTLVDWALAQ